MSSGDEGEEAACRLLRAKGLTVLERNFRCRGGEIDVVAEEAGTTVFVEVKRRSSLRHGWGFEAVDAAKRRRIVHAATVWAARHGRLERPTRFDVVSIDQVADGQLRIRHDRSAFDASE